MTVAVVEPWMPVCGSVAVIVTGLVVVFTPVAKPLTVIVIFVGSPDVQLTELVMSCVLESL